MYRGRSIQDYPGNQHLASVVSKRFSEYLDGSKADKTRFAHEVVQFIKTKARGRFLIRQDDSSNWTEVDDSAARTKVSHDFRNIKITARKRETKQSRMVERAALAMQELARVGAGSASTSQASTSSSTNSAKKPKANWVTSLYWGLNIVLIKCIHQSYTESSLKLKIPVKILISSFQF